MNYDGTVKAFAFLLGHECNVSHNKVRLFLSELTGNEMKISKGMINGLCEDFSSKTEVEQKEAYKTLLSSPVMINTPFSVNVATLSNSPYEQPYIFNLLYPVHPRL